MTLVLRGGFDLALAKPLSAAELKLGNTKLLGIEVYTDYLYPLQLAAVLLLVAISAAIALTLRERKDSRHMDASQQVRAKKADRVRLVRMAAVVAPRSLTVMVPQASVAWPAMGTAASTKLSCATACSLTSGGAASGASQGSSPTSAGPSHSRSQARL